MCPHDAVHHDTSYSVVHYSDSQQLSNREQTHHSAHTVCGCRTNRVMIWVCCCIDSAITTEEKKGRRSVNYESTVRSSRLQPINNQSMIFS